MSIDANTSKMSLKLEQLRLSSCSGALKESWLVLLFICVFISKNCILCI